MKKELDKVKKTSKKAIKKAKSELEIKEEMVKKDIHNRVNNFVESELNKVECVHCHKYFDKGLTICPYCKKSQRDKNGPVVIVILAVVLLICVIGSYFIDKYVNRPINDSSYKESCELVSYEI